MAMLSSAEDTLALVQCILLNAALYKINSCGRVYIVTNFIQHIYNVVEPTLFTKCSGASIKRCRDDVGRCTSILFPSQQYAYSPVCIFVDQGQLADIWPYFNNASGTHEGSFYQNSIRMSNFIALLSKLQTYRPHIADVQNSKLETLCLVMKAVGYVPDEIFVLQCHRGREGTNFLCYHIEKLAIAFGVLNTSPAATIRVVKTSM